MSFHLDDYLIPLNQYLVLHVDPYIETYFLPVMVVVAIVGAATWRRLARWLGRCTGRWVARRRGD
ncbi:hypothetical protein [Acidisoma sp. 7E03]